MKKILIATTTAILMSGCSVYKVLSQADPANLEGIGVGTPRQLVINQIGAPKMVDTDKHGNKQDYFEFESGHEDATKLRAIAYLGTDVILSLPPCSLVCPTQVGALREAMEVKQQSTMYSTPLYQESGVAAGTNAPQAVAATDHADHNADHDNHDDDDDRDASQAAPLGVDSSTSPSPTTRRPRCPAQDLREVETLYVRLKELLRSQTLGTP